MQPVYRFGVTAALAVLLAVASIAPSAAATKLRRAGQHPVDHNATLVLQETIKKIEDAGVDIEIRLFPAGQLGNGEQVFGDVAQGVIDIGHTFIYSHNDPVLEINSLPYLVGTYEEMRKVYSPGSNFYRIYEASLANQGLKLLGVFAEGFIGVGTSEEPTNPAVIGDKGLNIRVWSAEVGRLTAQEMGFRTTTMNWGDVIPAIQQGVIEGVIGGTAGIELHGLRRRGQILHPVQGLRGKHGLLHRSGQVGLPHPGAAGSPLGGVCRSFEGFLRTQRARGRGIHPAASGNRNPDHSRIRHGNQCHR